VHSAFTGISPSHLVTRRKGFFMFPVSYKSVARANPRRP
jgi:hypothetical protein